MRLTNYSDYALRALIYLAVKPKPHELATINDIAVSYDISKSHLTKIIHQLAKHGYIDSVRGKNGGIRLARAPKDINIGEVVKLTEPDFAIVDCFVAQVLDKDKPNDIAIDREDGRIATTDSKNSCVISPGCLLKSVFFEATQAFIDVLSRYTLEDLVLNAQELSKLLD